MAIENPIYPLFSLGFTKFTNYPADSPMILHRVGPGLRFLFTRTMAAILEVTSKLEHALLAPWKSEI